jgi:hypothetical protein
VVVVFVFFYDFSPKLYLSILFFNIKLVANYNYNIWKKQCSFLHKLPWIATVFSPHVIF